MRQRTGSILLMASLVFLVGIVVANTLARRASEGERPKTSDICLKTRTSTMACFVKRDVQNAQPSPPPEHPPTAENARRRPKYTTETLRGRVVWMAEALGRLFGVRSVPESKERLLALETPGRLLYPIVEDTRGRAFRRDARLREMDLELVVRRYEGSPMVQIIRLHKIAKEGKYELDYWCDVCAIALVELQPCDCCQGPIELRLRPVGVKQ